MTEEELKEIMALLEAEGWQPQLCDTQVPRFECTAEPTPLCTLFKASVPECTVGSVPLCTSCRSNIKRQFLKSPLSAVNTGEAAK